MKRAEDLRLSDRYRFEDNQYRDKVYDRNTYESDRSFGYQAGRDKIGDERYKDQTAYDRSQDTQNRELEIAGLTGWYKGQPTTTQQNIDMSFRQLLNSEGQQKIDNAVKLLNMGVYSPEIAKAAGMDDVSAKQIADYVRSSMTTNASSGGSGGGKSSGKSNGTKPKEETTSPAQNFIDMISESNATSRNLQSPTAIRNMINKWIAENKLSVKDAKEVADYYGFEIAWE